MVYPKQTSSHLPEKHAGKPQKEIHLNQPFIFRGKLAVSGRVILVAFAKKSTSKINQVASCDQKKLKHDTSSHTQNLTGYAATTFANLMAIGFFQASPANDWPLQGLYVLLRHVLEAGCLVYISNLWLYF